MSSFLFGRLRATPPTVQGAASGADGGNNDKLLAIVTAVVPADVLAIHAAGFAYFTTTTTAGDQTSTTITNPGRAQLLFVFCVVASALLTWGGLKRKPSGEVAARVALPPMAFMAWSLLTIPSAFDGFHLGLDEFVRFLIAAGLVVVVVTSASRLGLAEK
jgi:hypothetical protein